MMTATGGDSHSRLRRMSVLALVLPGCLLLAGSALAQELSPRSFWPTPVGTKVLVLGYAHQSGDVLMDSSIPL